MAKKVRTKSVNSHLFPFIWTLKDAIFTKDKGNVFSCFACGGGSTMGYKLAGFNVLGCNEIDPEMAARYKKNHDPKFCFVEPIQEFKLRERNKRIKTVKPGVMPEELFNLDILDGSPPCSSFSMAGNREDDWGKEKVFREGQSEQVLDTLFFDFIDLAKKLKPKVAVAENVKGLLLGNARNYVRRIYDAFDEAGYYVQHFLFDASKMGVPQRRERVFFIALRKDLSTPFLQHVDMFTIKPKLEFNFNEKPIKFGEYRDEVGLDLSHNERGKLIDLRIKTDKSLGDINKRVHNKVSGFNAMIRHDQEVCGTITAGEVDWRYYDGKACTDKDYILSGTFPLDYDFINDPGSKVFRNPVKYMIGMSVPPVMTAQIANQIWLQWLSKL
jgi:DNA (cytosine-5)-methyltransferase 1